MLHTYNIEQIRKLTARAYLFGIADFSEREKEALMEVGILSDESSIGGAMGALFTYAGLELAHAVAKAYCADAENTYRSLKK